MDPMYQEQRWSVASLRERDSPAAPTPAAFLATDEIRNPVDATLGVCVVGRRRPKQCTTRYEQPAPEGGAGVAAQFVTIVIVTMRFNAVSSHDRSVVEVSICLPLAHTGPQRRC